MYRISLSESKSKCLQGYITPIAVGTDPALVSNNYRAVGVNPDLNFQRLVATGVPRLSPPASEVMLFLSSPYVKSGSAFLL